MSAITSAMTFFEAEQEKNVTALRGREAGKEARVKLEAFHDALLARYGFKRRTWMFYDFDIHLEVKPVKAAEKPSASLDWLGRAPEQSFVWFAPKAA